MARSLALSLLALAIFFATQHVLARHERVRDLYDHAALVGTDGLTARIDTPPATAGMREDYIWPRQDSSGDATTSNLQAYSTTYSYSFTSYTPVTATNTTAFSSALVTSITVITVYASNSFHAFQSFLTAGQSVQDQANFIAALVTLMPAAPASALATTTDAYTTPAVTPTSIMATSTATALYTSTALLSAPSTSSSNGAVCTRVPRLGQEAAMVAAFAWANW